MAAGKSAVANLDEAIAEYNTSFTDFTYDLPEFWNKRDRYGLPLNHANLPPFSHLANFLMVELNSGSFPWGYVYGTLEIDDEEARVLSNIEHLVQMAAMNLTVFTVAFLLLCSAILVPLIFIVVFMFRQNGACGGKVMVSEVAYQKKSRKMLHCTIALLFCIAIMSGAIQFWTCANPLVTVIPDVVANIVKLGLQDFNKFFNYCIEEIRYFINEGLVKLLLGSVVTITEDFEAIIQNITSKLDLLELINITGTLDNVTKDLQLVRTSLTTTSEQLEIIDLAVTAIETDILAIKTSLDNIETHCDGFNTFIRAALCNDVPKSDDIPDNVNFQLDADLDSVIKTIDDLDLEGMFADYKSFNLSLVKDLARKSIPLDTIEALISNRTLDVQEGINWENLKPLNATTMEAITSTVQEMVAHPSLGYAGHVIRGLAIIPLIYVAMISMGIAMGIYATHDQKFPCPERNPTSTLGADFINRAQMFVLFFHTYFAVICALLLVTMSVVSILAESIYSQDIITRIIDRIPLAVLKRSLTVDLGGSIITVIFSAGNALKVCERNGGALKAAGIHVGHFSNITNVLDIIPWPDLEEFEDTINKQLKSIEESAIPKHGQTSKVQRYLDSFVLPAVDFDKVRSDLNGLSYIGGGINKSLSALSKDLQTKTNRLRQSNQAEANAIADELDDIIVSIGLIERNIQQIDDSLVKIEEQYNILNPLISKIKRSVRTIYDEMQALGRKLLEEAEKMTKDFVIDATKLLNGLKLNLRKSIFKIIDFLLNNMFRCGIFFEIYTVTSEVLYLYITRYLNGAWMSLAAICSWVFCAVSCWLATAFFQEIADLRSKKEMARKYRIGTPIASKHEKDSSTPMVGPEQVNFTAGDTSAASTVV